MSRLAALTTLAMLSAGLGDLSAQSLRGRVESDARPVAGAQVELISGMGASLLQTTSRLDGSFTLGTGAPPGSRLRVRAIGYGPMEVTLANARYDASGVLAVSMVPVAIELSTLDVLSRRQACRRSDASQAVLGTVLDVVRTADEVMRQALSNRQLRFLMTVDTVTAIFRAPRDSTLEQTRSTGLLVSWPGQSPDHHVLEREGFSRESVAGEGDGRKFYGPDLSVVVSDWFVDSHCLWIELSEESDNGQVALLHFAPDNERRVPEVEGRVVIRTGDWALLRLEFHYVGLPSWFPQHSGGGELRFSRTSDGVWYPASWLLHAPIERARRDLSRPVLGAIFQPRPTRPEVVGYTEVRGTVTSVEEGQR